MHRFLYIAAYWSKIAEKPTPLSFDTTSPANPREYPHKPYFGRNSAPWATFLPLAVWVYRHSYFSGDWCAPKDTCVM